MQQVDAKVFENVLSEAGLTPIVVVRIALGIFENEHEQRTRK